ncbi:MAG: (2Fe-2S)-binding protein [Actinobacteria bacterium]|nr:(2Fe-2S)-binding protein [Actinomycetota bacterium]
MVKLIIDGQHIEVEDGLTVLEAAKRYGIDIPTLCHDEGLSEYGACRICMVELKKGERSSLVASCCFPVRDGIEILTDSLRVQKARKMIIELMLASCPNSRTLQCLASKYGVTRVRFKSEDRGCLLCGLCVRMCEQQMKGGAIGFAGRGVGREVAMPFHHAPAECRECGACLYICPVCELPCCGPLQPGELCNSCFENIRIEPFPCRE